MQFAVYDLGTVCRLTRSDANRLIPCVCLAFKCLCVFLSQISSVEQIKRLPGSEDSGRSKL